MSPRCARKAVLAFVLACLAGGLWATARAAPSETAPAAAPPSLIELKAVGPSVYAALDGPSHGAGANAGFIVGDDGVLVVDSFYDPGAARELLAAIRKVTDKPVRYVVNTHYHVDHVAGDGVLRDAGAIVVAHRNVRAWVRSENIHVLGDRITPAQRTLVEHLTLPDVGVDRRLTIWLGARRVEIREAQGHTGGDLVVEVPDARVVFCGDILWRRVSPNLIDARVAAWIDTLAQLEAAPDAKQTTFVPGHGGLGALADVEALRTYFTDLRSLTADGRHRGLAGDALVADVLPALRARYGDWDAFSYFAPREIGFMEAELTGSKRTPKVPAE